MRDTIKPVLKARRTNAAISNQGYTYNQPGLSYNGVGVTYGGIYGKDIYSIVPSVKSPRPATRIKNVSFNMKVGRTDSQISNQGYTYNEFGVSYNQTGVQYGGVYGNDIYPMLSMAKLIKPTIRFAFDYKGSKIIPPGANSGMLIGMLGLTYP